jgi:hypothetical protein
MIKTLKRYSMRKKVSIDDISDKIKPYSLQSVFGSDIGAEPMGHFLHEF